MAGRRYGGGGATIVDSTASVTPRYMIPPLLVAIVGILTVLFGVVIAITIQVQTTEANLAGLSSIDAFKPNLYVLWQPVDLLTSANLTFAERMAYTIAWIIQIASFIFIVGYSDALEVAGSSGWVMQRFWFLLSWALFAFNFLSDYKYGSVPGAQYGWLGHLEFAVGITAAAMFFPLIGLHLIRKASFMAKMQRGG